MLVRCPSCRNTFSTERTGPQDCPSCGKPLVVPEAAIPSTTQPGFPPAEEAPAEQGTPWERRAEIGFWRGWWETVVQALFDPRRLFRSARLDRGAAQAGFALLTAGVPWFIGQTLDRFLVQPWKEQWMERLNASGPLAPWLQRIAAAGNDNSPRAVLVVAVIAPLVVLVALYANAAVSHAAALLLGQAKRGFAATFAACAYASAPLLLTAVPGCGAVVGLVWAAVLTAVGLKETHRIAAGGAAAVALAPYALLCCAGCVLSVLAWVALRGAAQ